MIERLSAACPLQPDGRLRASLLGHIHRIADRRSRRLALVA